MLCPFCISDHCFFAASTPWHVVMVVASDNDFCWRRVFTVSLLIRSSMIWSLMFLFVHLSEQKLQVFAISRRATRNCRRIHQVVDCGAKSSCARLTCRFALRHIVGSYWWPSWSVSSALAIIWGSGWLGVSRERNREWALCPAYLHPLCPILTNCCMPPTGTSTRQSQCHGLLLHMYM